MSVARWFNARSWRHGTKLTRSRWARSQPHLEELESRSVPSSTPFPSGVVPEIEGGVGTAPPQSIAATGTVAGSLTSRTDVDAYRVRLSQDGVLNVHLDVEAGATFNPRLILSGLDGREIVRSDARTADGLVAAIVQNLPYGDYVVQVSAQTGSGLPTEQGYHLQTRFAPAPLTREDTPTGSAPFGQVLADVNEDGQVDLITANGSSNDVSVLLGNGDGSFQSQRRFAVGDSPIEVVSGDLNRDGHDDLATANLSSNDVSILLGRGDGSFAEQQRFNAGVNPLSLALGDFNLDGRADLVTVSAFELVVLLGRGDGTFANKQLLPVAAISEAVSVIDVNGDNRPDLVKANLSSNPEFVIGLNTVSVLLGNGDGTFQPERSFDVGAVPTNVTGVDVNGDDRPDLVTVNFFDDSVSVLLNNGGASFQSPRRYSVGNYPTSLAVEDVSGDGQPDVVVANRDSGDVSVLLGNGDGSFQTQRRYGAATDAISLSLGMLSGDDNFDVVITSFFTDRATVLLGNGEGSFQASKRLGTGGMPRSVALGDFNEDGRPDLVTANRSDQDSVTVLQGNGDGTFQFDRRFEAGDNNPNGVTVADVNVDGADDLIVAAGSVAIRLGNGDGSFQSASTLDDALGMNVVAADVNGDTFPDLIGAYFGGQVALGNGDGSFQPARRLELGELKFVVVGDVNRDDRPDLVAASYAGDNLTVLLGNGDGTFNSLGRFPVGTRPYAAVLGDVNGDKQLDLVSVNVLSDDVSVSLGNGNGTFRQPVRFDVGDKPYAVALGDVNGDGTPEIVTANTFSNEVTILLGIGDGSFQPQRRFGVGSLPRSVAMRDVNGDGRPDLITANSSSDTVTVLLGNGDGTFVDNRRFGVGASPRSLTASDVNGDGRADLITPNFLSDNVSVLLGNGDGTVQLQRRLDAGDGTSSVTAVDINRDGRTDLIAANRLSNDLSVFLGQGDGSFQLERRFQSGEDPTLEAVVDVNADGFLDLITVNRSSGDVSVLLGEGNGSFGEQRRLAIGQRPFALSAADLDGDGTLDLVVSGGSGYLSVLLGNGDGTFQPERRIDAGERYGQIEVADINGDGIVDLVATLPVTGVSVVLGNGNGTFQQERRTETAESIASLAVADVNGDGLPDLITTNFLAVTVLGGNGDGTFDMVDRIVVPGGVYAVAVVDINRDGLFDLATANFSNDVTVLLGDGTGQFVATIAERTADLRHTPQHADLDKDGIADVVVLNDAGEILFRRGLANTDNLYASPRVLNPDRPARDLILVTTSVGPVIAVSDLLGALTPQPDGSDRTTFSLSVYALSNPGIIESRTLELSAAPQRLVAGDLNGDGLDDLAVVNTRADTVTLVFQRPNGSFVPAVPLHAGLTPGEIALADLDGRDGLDLVIANQFSADIRVLYNDPAQTFFRHATFRGGLSVPHAELLDGVFQTRSLEQPVSLSAGRFNEDGRTDIVVVNRGSTSFNTLLGSPGGGLTNPSKRFRLSTNDGPRVNEEPGQSLVTDFNGDSRLDLAILMEDRNQVWLYLGQGDGTFKLKTTIPAGNLPTGFSLAQLNDDNGDQRQDGNDVLDLVVGNGFGDVLFVLGNGDGTFRPFVRSDNRVPFVTSDLDGNGSLDVILAQQTQDRALSLLRGGTAFVPGDFEVNGDDGLIGPGDVALADLDGRFGDDLIIANTGSNTVLVYLRGPDGKSFRALPERFFTGTSPVALHVALLDEDDQLDLAVANAGSNDVSVLLGSQTLTGDWTLRLGPRLSTGRFAPSQVSSQFIDGDAIADLIVLSQEGGTASMIRGVGEGFFDDGGATTVDLGGSPLDTDGGIVLVDGGGFVGVNFAADNVVTPLFSLGRDVVAFDTQAVGGQTFPVLFTASSDGTLSTLTTEDGVTFEEVLLPTGAGLDGLGTLANLAVFETGAATELYVVDRGGALTVIRFGIDDFENAPPTPEPPEDGSLAVVASLAGANSLLVSPRPFAGETALDVATIFGAETLEGVSGDFSPAAGATVGEGILAALLEALASADDEAPFGVGAPLNSLQQFLIGLDDAIRNLGWQRLPEADLLPPQEPERWHWWDWWRSGQELLDWLRSGFSPEREQWLRPVSLLRPATTDEVSLAAVPERLPSEAERSQPAEDTSAVVETARRQYPISSASSGDAAAVSLGAALVLTLVVHIREQRPGDAVQACPPDASERQRHDSGDRADDRRRLGRGARHLP